MLTTNVWIDLDNSPHVHFFAPIIKYLERQGIRCLITLRSYSQTEELARWYGLTFVTVGEHRTPRHLVTRVAATVKRAAGLAAYARRQKATVAISHGSRALALAASCLRIPILTLYDYEFVSCRLFNMVSNRVLVPEKIPAERLRNRGLNLDRLVTYPGFKEEVYIYDFTPDPKTVAQLKLDPKELIVTLRPPATWAHYQDPRSGALFHALAERLSKMQHIQVVILPRTHEQATELQNRYAAHSTRFQVPSRAVDALSLMWYSDVVFSGGGTMVREAALLGRNTYSIFAGKLGAADEALARRGLLKFIRQPEDIDRLDLRKSSQTEIVNKANFTTRDFIFRAIHGFIRESSSREITNGAHLDRQNVA